MTGQAATGISRRSWLKRLGAIIGAGAWLRRLPGEQIGDASAGSVETGPLISRVSRPFDAETPVREFSSFLTPAHRFFVRSHFGPPAQEVLSDSAWRLRVGGLVGQVKEFNLTDVRRMDPVTLTVVVQCSGNGRAFHRPKVPGVQWERGAVGNAQWTGVRLREVLAQAGLKPEAKHVQFQGADRPMATTVPSFIRSIPLEKAMHPDTLLAYEMNGRPLPLLHGAPLRVITPGWMADSCIKWLTDITVQEEESKGYYMQTAYRMPAKRVEPGAAPEGQVMLPVEEMTVKSLIAAPAEGDLVPAGPVTIQGVAWSGEARVRFVEVSIDEGKTWEQARFIGEDHAYAWRQWQYIWNPRQSGTYAILSRATDERGATQPATSPWNPGGFLWNGWDRVTVSVNAGS